jgi:hypothetical protein
VSTYHTKCVLTTLAQHNRDTTPQYHCTVLKPRHNLIPHKNITPHIHAIIKGLYITTCKYHTVNTSSKQQMSQNFYTIPQIHTPIQHTSPNLQSHTFIPYHKHHTYERIPKCILLHTYLSHYAHLLHHI